MNKFRYFLNSFLWVAGAKVADAVLKFATIPLLLKYFGKDMYGILVLAISTNAYMDLLDLGINTGAIKYFSQWIEEDKYPLIQKVARTSISFYLVIGIINSIALLFLAGFGDRLFHVTASEFHVLQRMFIILSVYCLVNWSTSIFNQLLVADEKMRFIQFINIVKSLLNLTLVLITVRYHLQLVTYFTLALTVNTLVLVPYYFRAKKYKLIKSFLPAFDWPIFKPILTYSLAIFAMGIFQFTATQSRPVILGMFSTLGPKVLAEYRVIEVFPLFIISIGGMIITILLPIASKYVLHKQIEKMENMAYKGTLYTSILVSLLCFPILINSRDILTLYVGREYAFLSPWLNLWLITILLYLHNSPVSSLILATGKTRMLVYSSATACIISIIINATLAPAFAAGSAVIGYFIYIVIQMSFYYLYINKRILNLDSFRIFKSFLKPTLVASLSSIPMFFVNFPSLGILGAIIVKSFLWVGIFVISLHLFKLMDYRQLLLYSKKVS